MGGPPRRSRGGEKWTEGSQSVNEELPGQEGQWVLVAHLTTPPREVDAAFLALRLGSRAQRVAGPHLARTQVGLELGAAKQVSPLCRFQEGERTGRGPGPHAVCAWLSFPRGEAEQTVWVQQMENSSHTWWKWPPCDAGAFARTTSWEIPKDKATSN